MNNQTQKPTSVTTENLISEFGSHFCVSTGRTGKIENLKVYQELGKTPLTNELDAYHNTLQQAIGHYQYLINKDAENFIGSYNNDVKCIYGSFSRFLTYFGIKHSNKAKMDYYLDNIELYKNKLKTKTKPDIVYITGEHKIPEFRPMKGKKYYWLQLNSGSFDLKEVTVKDSFIYDYRGSYTGNYEVDQYDFRIEYAMTHKGHFEFMLSFDNILHFNGLYYLTQSVNSLIFINEMDALLYAKERLLNTKIQTIEQIDKIDKMIFKINTPSI